MNFKKDYIFYYIHFLFKFNKYILTILIFFLLSWENIPFNLKWHFPDF